MTSNPPSSQPLPRRPHPRLRPLPAQAQIAVKPTARYPFRQAAEIEFPTTTTTTLRSSGCGRQTSADCSDADRAGNRAEVTPAIIGPARPTRSSPSTPPSSCWRTTPSTSVKDRLPHLDCTGRDRAAQQKRDEFLAAPATGRRRPAPGGRRRPQPRGRPDRHGPEPAVKPAPRRRPLHATGNGVDFDSAPAGGPALRRARRLDAAAASGVRNEPLWSSPVASAAATNPRSASEARTPPPGRVVAG